MLTNEQMQALKRIGSEHKTAVDRLIRLYQRNYITCHELSERIAALKAEYDRKAEPFIQTAALIAKVMPTGF